MATIIHFGFSAEAPKRAMAFYENLLGWKFQTYPGPMEFYLIETTGLDGQRGIGGGMAKRENPQDVGVTNFMAVASIDESSEQVKKLGGKVIQQKQAIPGVGYQAMCLDTENNLFGLFQDDKNAK